MSRKSRISLSADDKSESGELDLEGIDEDEIEKVRFPSHRLYICRLKPNIIHSCPFLCKGLVPSSVLKLLR